MKSLAHIHYYHTRAIVDGTEEVETHTKNRAYNFIVFSHRIRNIVVPFTQEVGKSISQVMRRESEREREKKKKETKKKIIGMDVCFLIR